MSSRGPGSVIFRAAFCVGALAALNCSGDKTPSHAGVSSDASAPFGDSNGDATLAEGSSPDGATSGDAGTPPSDAGFSPDGNASLSLQDELEFEKAPPPSSVPSTSSTLDLTQTLRIGNTLATVSVYGPRIALAAQGTNVYVATSTAAGNRETAVDYLASVLSQALCSGYRSIQIPKQNLVFDGFQTTIPRIPIDAGASACEQERVAILNDQTTSYHLTLSNLQDVAIDFQGSTLNFTNPMVRGLEIASPNPATVTDRKVQRARLSNFNVSWVGQAGIDYLGNVPGAPLVFASPSTMTRVDANTVTLAIQISDAGLADAQSAGLPLRNLMGYYDFVHDVWSARVPGTGFEVSFPFTPGPDGMSIPLAKTVTFSQVNASADAGVDAMSPRCTATPGGGSAATIPCAVFASMSALAAQGPVKALLRHHGTGHSVVVFGTNTEDVQLDNVSLESGAYMGFAANNARGFSLTNSKIDRLLGALLSTSSDGLHVTGTSDVFVSGNSFRGMGDDGTNVQSNTYPIQSIDSAGVTQIPCVLSPSELSTTAIIYDAEMRYLGTVSFSNPGACTNNLQQVTASNPSNGLTDLAAIAGRIFGIREHQPKRVVYQGNTIGDHRGRGILVQASMVQVSENTFDSASGPAVLVTADNYTFHEGLGSTSVLLQNNTFTNDNFIANQSFSGGTSGNNPYPAVLSVVALVSGDGGTPMITPSALLLNLLVQGNTFGSASSPDAGENFGPKYLFASGTEISVSGNSYDTNVPVDLCSTMSQKIGVFPLNDAITYSLAPADFSFKDGLAVQTLPTSSTPTCP